MALLPLTPKLKPSSDTVYILIIYNMISTKILQVVPPMPLPSGVLEAAAPSKIQIENRSTKHIPLTSRLAALYYSLSFGYAMYIWTLIIILCAIFPLLWLPVTA